MKFFKIFISCFLCVLVFFTFVLCSFAGNNYDPDYYITKVEFVASSSLQDTVPCIYLWGENTSANEYFVINGNFYFINDLLYIYYNENNQYFDDLFIGYDPMRGFSFTDDIGEFLFDSGFDFGFNSVSVSIYSKGVDDQFSFLDLNSTAIFIQQGIDIIVYGIPIDGYDSVVHCITDFFDSQQSFFVDSLESLSTLFYDDGLTFVGVLSIVALGVGLILLLFYFISSYMKLRS